ncbi:MAG TPA: UDP-2,3-diacylglucosamine diphosphatase [Acidiferrobacteraceae bacterium]|nr:UDP-2,3-diacylglucosamine diphosphatase [Acidiferrobacteraceae bacterium]
MKPLKFRSIWISDIHLGHRACKAEFLLDFLKHTRCEQLYLVGDVIDLWNMKNGWYWPQSHNNVIRSILGKAKRGTKVTYIPGNHDEMFRNYTNTSFGEVDIVAEAIHETADGRQLLVLHGDEFDSIVKHNKSIAHLGSQAYDFLLWVNHYIDMFRRKLGFPYWSLATYLKHKVKNAVKYISNFEKAVIHEARRRKVDGLVCGHIHKAAIKEYEGILYCNDGDWVESCSALVEHHDGTLEILNWTDTDKFKEELHSIENNNRRGRLVSAN